MRLRCLPVVLLAVSLFFYVLPVYALTVANVTVTYTEFNQAYTSLSVYPKSKLLSNINLIDWTAIITQNLVLNTTSSSYFAGVCISGTNYTGVAVGVDIIKVHFYINGYVKLFYTNSSGDLTLIDFYYSGPIKIQHSNSTIKVWSGDTFLGGGTVYVDVMPKYLLYRTNYPNLVLSGQATITVSTDLQTKQLVDVVIQLLPAFMLIGCLGVALAMMGRAVKQ